MERDTHKRRDDNDRSETPGAMTNEKATRGKGEADGVTGVSQDAYEEAKDDAVKDVHG